MKKTNVDTKKVRELSTAELAQVSGGEPLVCPVGTHHANGQCVKN